MAVDVNDLAKLPPPPPWTPKPYDAEAEGDMLMEDEMLSPSADGLLADRPDDRTDLMPSVRTDDPPSADGQRTGWIGRLEDHPVVWGGRLVQAERAAWRVEPATVKAWHLRHYGENGKQPNPHEVDKIMAEVRPELARRASQHRIQAAAVVIWTPLSLYVGCRWAWWLFTLDALVFAAAVGYLAVRGRPSARPLQPSAPSGDPSADGVRTVFVTSERTALDRTTLQRALESSVPHFKEGMEIEVSPATRMGETGSSVDVRLPPEVSATDVVAARHALATRLDSSDSCLVLRPWRDKNRILSIGLYPSDPLAGPPNASPMATPRTIDVTDGVPFGTAATGHRLRFMVVGAHTFIAGSTRIGKTDAMCLIAEGMGLDFNARQLLLDPEGVGVFDPLAGRATVIAGTSPADRRQMAQALHGLATTGLAERGQLIKEYVRKNPKGLNTSAVTREVARDATAHLPWQFWMLDECHVLFTDPDPEVREMAINAAYTLLSRGGKYGVWGVLSSQRPTKEAGTPPQLIGQCANRFCMAMNDSAGVTAVLGKWVGTGMDPTALDSDEHKGVGYLTGPALPNILRPWALVRADWIDRNGHEPIQEYAIAQAGRRPEVLPAPPAEDEAEPAVAAEAEKVDTTEIERLAGLFSGEPLDWRTIVEGLKGFGYRLSTKATLIDWLARPNVGLVLARLDIDGRRFVGLRPEAVRDALDYLLEGVTEGGDGVVTEGVTEPQRHVPAHQRHPQRHPRKTLADLPFPAPSPSVTPFDTPPSEG